MSLNSLTAAMTDRDFEQVVICRDPASGLESVIAIHDTSRGPSLGGIRMRAYPDHDAAVADALNLAEAMTFKAALAGLQLEGGKNVINADPMAPNRDALLTAHAHSSTPSVGATSPAYPLVADIDHDRVWAVCAEFGASAVDDALRCDADVLCPCAAGGVLDHDVLDALTARYVVGAANNLLAEPSVAVAMADRGIVHVLDFVANAGGLIACEAELRGEDSTLLSKVDAIEDTSAQILKQSTATGADSASVAIEVAHARLAEQRPVRPHFGTP